MALISTDVSAVSSDILYDSGWKQAKGKGSTYTVETMTYTVDSIVHIYGKRWFVTQAADWQLQYNYSTTGTSYWSYWHPLHRPWEAPIGSTTAFIGGAEYEIVDDSGQSTTNPSNRDMVSGYSLKAGSVVMFKGMASASTSDGMEYRIVVEKNTSTKQLTRSLGSST